VGGPSAGVGRNVGAMVGREVGVSGGKVGKFVGLLVGSNVGLLVGEKLGANVGAELGSAANGHRSTGGAIRPSCRIYQMLGDYGEVFDHTLSSLRHLPISSNLWFRLPE